MAKIELLRVALTDDHSGVLTDAIRKATATADPLDEFPVIHLATPDRRARNLRAKVYDGGYGTYYPAATPERVARELAARFAATQPERTWVQRDFDMFRALSAALAELGDAGLKRRAGRPLIDELLRAWKRLCEAVPPAQRTPDLPPEWRDALGSRFEVFAKVVNHYSARLAQLGARDPDDVAWLVADGLPGWDFAPKLLLIDDLDRVSPAREALLRALADKAERTLIVLRGNRETLPFLARSHEVLQDITLHRDGTVLPELPDLPARPRAELVHAWTEDRPGQAPALHCIQPHSRAAEVREAARFVRRSLNAGVAADQICIAMPRPDNYAALIEETFTSSGIAYDAPFEVPIDRTAPVAAILDLVRAARAGLERNDLLDALASPFLKFSGDKPLAQLSDETRVRWMVGGRDIRRNWLERLADRPELVAWLQPVLEQLEPFVRDQGKPAALARAALELLRNAGARDVAESDLDGGNPGADVRAGAAYEFERLLGEMAAEFEGEGRIPVSEFLRALTEQAASRSVRAKETRDHRVRVLGLRELRGAEMSHVMVLGLTDADLPLGEDDSMFFPSMREDALAAAAGKVLAAELCAPIDVARQADYLFAHMLMAGPGQLVLSMPAFEGDAPFVPALALDRLLRCLGNADAVLPPALEAESPTSLHDLARAAARALTAREAGRAEKSGSLELSHEGLKAGAWGRLIELQRSDLCAAPTEFEGNVGEFPELAERFAPSGSHTFSPSQLDMYAECPMRFWSRYVMGTKEKEDPTLDTPPHAVGTLLHDVFERYALLLREKAKQPRVLDDPTQRKPVGLLDVAADADKARELGHRLIRQAFEDAFAADARLTGPFWQGVRLRACAGLPDEPDIGLGHGILVRFIEEELEREADGIRLLFTEFDFGSGKPADETQPDKVPDVFELPVEGGVMRLRGSVDRVDHSDAGLEIVDYKTGSAKTTDEVLTGSAFQLVTYLAAIARATGIEPRGMSYLLVPLQKAVERQDVTVKKVKREIVPAYDVGVMVNEILPRRLGEVMGAISTGVFVHLPFVKSTSRSGPCRYCDFKAACAVRMDVVEERRRLDPPEPPGLYLPHMPPELADATDSEVDDE